MTTVRYLSAVQWGGTWIGTPATEKIPDGECYVHHIGAPGVAWHGEDAIAVFGGLNEYAQNVKGYQFLDYDILTHYSRRDDLITVAEGRGKYRSAAQLDRNEEGEAVLACGNYNLRDPLPAEVEGLALGVVYGIDHGWIAKDTLILGHRDNPAHPDATTCPGDHLYAQLPVIRNRVTDLLTPPAPPSPPPSGDDMKRYLARLDTNAYHYRVGDGIRAEVLRSNEYVALKARFEGDFPGYEAGRYYHPWTGQQITEWADIPALNETQLDLDVGYVTEAGKADEG